MTAGLQNVGTTDIHLWKPLAHDQRRPIRRILEGEEPLLWDLQVVFQHCVKGSTPAYCSVAPSEENARCSPEKEQSSVQVFKLMSFSCQHLYLL